MARLNKIIKGFIAKISGNSKNAQVASFEEFAGDQRKGQVFGPCNEDFSPPDNTFSLSDSSGKGRGLLFLLGYYNPFITPIAKRGERRLYSTTSGGTSVQTEVFLKQDGTLLLQNSAGVSVTLTPSGEINIVSPGNMNVTSAKAIFDCPVDINGNLVVTGDNDTTGNLGVVGSFTVNGVDIGETHQHSGVTVGGANTGGVT